MIFRGDSAFCRDKIFTWCEKNNIGYITGLIQNNILKKHIHSVKKSQKFFYEFKYGGKSWSTKRRIIIKVESKNNESKTNFIVTNLDGALNPTTLLTITTC